MNRTIRLAMTTAAAVALLTACSGGDTQTGGSGPIIGGTPTSGTTAPTTTPATTSAAAPAASPGGSTGNPDRCTTGELTGSLTGQDAGAGSVYHTLVLTNAGTRTCELTGFPGVSYVTGDDGHQVGLAARMDGESNGPVRLGVGGSAGAALQLVQVAAFDQGVCMPTPVRGLRVYPPGDTASLFVPLETTGCAGEGIPGDQMSVQAVRAR